MIDFSPENENRIEFRSMTTPLTGFKYRTPSAALRCLAEGTLKLPLEMGVLSFVQNVDKELRNGGKASTCGIHAGI